MLHIISNADDSFLGASLDFFAQADSLVFLAKPCLNPPSQALAFSIAERVQKTYVVFEDNTIFVKNWPSPPFTMISYDAFVELCCHHHPIQTWY